MVSWHAPNERTYAPLIEAVMVGRSGTHAISFVRKSEPLPQWIAEWQPPHFAGRIGGGR